MAACKNNAVSPPSALPAWQNSGCLGRTATQRRAMQPGPAHQQQWQLHPESMHAQEEAQAGGCATHHESGLDKLRITGDRVGPARSGRLRQVLAHQAVHAVDCDGQQDGRLGLDLDCHLAEIVGLQSTVASVKPAWETAFSV